MILHEFFDAAARFDDVALAELLHPEARISELPNAINRDGTERDAEQAREAFERISAAVSDVGTRIQAIAEATNEVALVAEQSSASTQQVSASTEETSASTQEIASSAADLARTAESLDALVSRFTVI